MKILLTQDGGLRIEVEDPDDWRLLKGITHDAVSCDEKLASRLGNLVTDPDVAPDWQEYIVPDLDEGFSSDLFAVASAIAAARFNAAGAAGTLWIPCDQVFPWYSALNQARLALEQRFQFGPGPAVDPARLPPAHRAAFLRSQFYCAIQSLLLELGMP